MPYLHDKKPPQSLYAANIEKKNIWQEIQPKVDISAPRTGRISFRNLSRWNCISSMEKYELMCHDLFLFCWDFWNLPLLPENSLLPLPFLDVPIVFLAKFIFWLARKLWSSILFLLYAFLLSSVFLILMHPAQVNPSKYTSLQNEAALYAASISQDNKEL